MDVNLFQKLFYFQKEIGEGEHIELFCVVFHVYKKQKQEQILQRASEVIAKWALPEGKKSFKKKKLQEGTAYVQVMV